MLSIHRQTFAHSQLTPVLPPTLAPRYQYTLSSSDSDEESEETDSIHSDASAAVFRNFSCVNPHSSPNTPRPGSPGTNVCVCVCVCVRACVCTLLRSSSFLSTLCPPPSLLFLGRSQRVLQAPWVACVLQLPRHVRVVVSVRVCAAKEAAVAHRLCLFRRKLPTHHSRRPKRTSPAEAAAEARAGPRAAKARTRPRAAAAAAAAAAAMHRAKRGGC